MKSPPYSRSRERLDGAGKPIAGARAEHRIGRDVEFAGSWSERADTRSPPGEHVTIARAWKGGRTAEATTARITVEVHPDAFYERLDAGRLAGELPPATRAAYEAALARAKASHYVAEQHDIAIALSSTR